MKMRTAIVAGVSLSASYLLAQQVILENCTPGTDGSLVCKFVPSPLPTSPPPPPPTPTPTPTITPTPPVPPPLVRYGYGKESKGGDGGTTYKFTTLMNGQDFLNILSKPHPRIVDIDSDVTEILLPCSKYVLKQPFITINGNGKVVIKKSCVESDYMFGSVHDVVVRNLTFDGGWHLFHKGRDGGYTAGTMNMGNWGLDGEAVPLAGQVEGNENLYFENVQWRNGSDSSPDIWGRNRKITFFRCIFGPDNFHSQSISFKSYAAVGTHDSREQITIYQSAYYKGGGDRNPKIKNGVYNLDFINNIVSYWENLGGQIGTGPDGHGLHFETGPASLNIINSAFLPGLWQPSYTCYVGTKPDAETAYDTVIYLFFQGNFTTSSFECRMSKRNGVPVTQLTTPAYAQVPVLPVNQLRNIVQLMGPQGSPIQNLEFVNFALSKLPQ